MAGGKHLRLGTPAGGGGGGNFAIENATGTKSHGSTVTIVGDLFGTKSTAAPVIYDDGTAVSTSAAGWSGAFPTDSGSTYNMDYRTPATVGRGVALPHTHNTKYLCGCHTGPGGPNGSYNVMVGVDRTMTGVYPQYTYFNYWARYDPGWTFVGVNHKEYDWTNGFGGTYDLAANWYLEYYQYGSANGGANWHINPDDFNSTQSPDANGNTFFDTQNFSSANNPFQAWKKIEYRMKWQTNNTGYIKVYDNGLLRVDYLGKTDGSGGGWSSNQRSEMIGGYSSNYPFTTNFRYYSDIYYDTTLQHVALGNASTYSACTVREPQVPTAWANQSITITFKQGIFTTGQTRWLYVVDATGANTAGFPITIA